MRRRGLDTTDSPTDSATELKKPDRQFQSVAREQQHSQWVSRAKRTALVLSLIYISVPILFYLFPRILGHIIFSHLLRIPVFVDLTRPAGILNHTCNFYLTPEEGVSVGVWHTLPASQWEQSLGKGPEWYRQALGDDEHPVMIYLHGNVGTRALHHRVELVKVLSVAGYHVLSLDYRGYGDSSGEPSEAGLTSDALYLYQWVKERSSSSSSRVYIWGHSLGTGVATNAALKVQEQGSGVDALILEAPYTNIGEASESHPICTMYMFIPGFRTLLWNILEMNNIVLANDKNLETLTSPVLILHSEDDDILPYHMGQKLYQIALKAQRERDAEGRVKMVSYPASLGYSHNHIYLDPNLSSVVGRYLQDLEK